MDPNFGEPVEVKSKAQRFGESFVRNVLPSTRAADYVEGPMYAAKHPLDALGLIVNAFIDSHKQQAGKTAEAARGIVNAPTLAGKAGAASEMLGHGLATVLPVVGPAAANAGEQIASGDVAGGLGATAGILSPLMGPSVASGAGKLTAPLREMVADKLHTSAIKGVEKAINPTRVDTKVRTARIAPEILERRVTATSLPKLEAKAAEKSAAAGADVDAALTPHANATTSTDLVTDALEKAKEPYIGTATNGQKVINDPQRVKAIQKLQDTLTEYGPNISVESMVKLRRNLDQVVEAGKGFTTPKASVKAWAAREGRSALRDQLSATVPNLDKVNAEYSFWQTLEDVAHATNQRRTGQNGTLLTTISGGAGAVVGEALGATATTKGLGAILGAKTFASLKRLVDSPGYRLWSAVQKERLADAIAARNVPQVKGLISSGLDAAGTTSRATARVKNGQVAQKDDATDAEPSAPMSARGSRQ